MLTSELRAILAADGWTFQHNMESSGVPWGAYKVFPDFENRPGEDRPPAIELTPWELEAPRGSGEFLLSVEISVRGPVSQDESGMFKIYSVPYEDLMQKLPGTVSILRAAWNAVALQAASQKEMSSPER